MNKNSLNKNNLNKNSLSQAPVANNQAYLSRIVSEFEKEDPDYDWLVPNLKSQFSVEHLTMESLMFAPSVLFFIFSRNKIIKNKNYKYFFNHCDLNRFNQMGFNSLFSYFRLAREREIKLNNSQIKKLLIDCDFHKKTEKFTSNLFNIYVTFDYGYTRFNNECQVLFLSKICQTDSISTLASYFTGIQQGLLQGVDAQGMNYNIDDFTKQKFILDSFNFKLPVVEKFFTDLLREIIKRKQDENNMIIKYLDQKLVNASISNKVKKTTRNNILNKI